MRAFVVIAAALSFASIASASAQDMDNPYAGRLSRRASSVVVDPAKTGYWGVRATPTAMEYRANCSKFNDRSLGYRQEWDDITSNVRNWGVSATLHYVGEDSEHPLTFPMYNVRRRNWINCQAGSSNGPLESPLIAASTDIRYSIAFESWRTRESNDDTARKINSAVTWLSALAGAPAPLAALVGRGAEYSYRTDANLSWSQGHEERATSPLSIWWSLAETPPSDLATWTPTDQEPHVKIELFTRASYFAPASFATFESLGNYFTNASPESILRYTARDRRPPLESLISDVDGQPGQDPTFRELQRATTAEIFSTNCRVMRSTLERLGFSTADRALILWALARDHAFLGHEVGGPNRDAAERSDCIQGLEADLRLVGISLTRRTDPRVPPSLQQMNSSIATSLSAAMRPGSPVANRRLAIRNFFDLSNGVAISDTLTEHVLPLGGSGIVLREADPMLTVIDTFSKIECWTFAPGATTPSLTHSVAYAIGLVGSREVLVTLTFAPTPAGLSNAVANEFNVAAAPAADSDLRARMRQYVFSQWGDSCESGWRPASLFDLPAPAN